MAQIIKNISFVFILPLLIGFLARFLIRKTNRAFILTICLGVLAAIMWGINFVVPSHGSELYGILAMIASCLAVGSVIAEVVTRICHK